MKKALIDYMVEKMGGEEAVQRLYENERPISFQLDLPAELANKLNAEAESSSIEPGEVIQLALLDYFTAPPKEGTPEEIPKELEAINGAKLVAVLKKQKTTIQPTRIEARHQEEMVLGFLVKHKGRLFYSHEVADNFVEFTSGQVSRILRRLIEKKRIKKTGEFRGTKYYV